MSTPRRRKPPPPRPKSRRARPNDGDFWGNDGLEPIEAIEPAAEPTALISSLGPPPLPGVGPDALFPLASVYDKAAALAKAVAAASGLLPVRGDPARDVDFEPDGPDVR